MSDWTGPQSTWSGVPGQQQLLKAGICAVVYTHPNGQGVLCGERLGTPHKHPSPKDSGLPVRGPALIYITDGEQPTMYRLDRMSDGQPDSNVVDDRIPQRDRNILMALWETYLPYWRLNRP